MLAELELTPQQYGVLLGLDSLVSCSQRTLAAALGIDPRNLVAVLDALERRGLVVRRPDPDDRRRRAVSLTAAGSGAAERLRRAGEDLDRELAQGLDGAEQAALRRILTKLVAGL